MDKYKTDEELVLKVQTGKGDPAMYEGLGNNIFIETFFAGTQPATPRQDYLYGNNNLIGAKALRYQINFNHTLKADGYTDSYVRSMAPFF